MAVPLVSLVLFAERTGANDRASDTRREEGGQEGFEIEENEQGEVFGAIESFYSFGYSMAGISVCA